MKHPEKGEVYTARDVLVGRLTAVTETDADVLMASVSRDSGEIVGEGGAVRAVYGDLFDIAEMAEAAEGPVHKFIADIAFGMAPDAALRSLYMIAVAHGVLMERARWNG